MSDDLPAAKRGRPPKDPATRLSEILRFRATEAEADAIYRAALKRGQTLSEYLRDRLFPVATNTSAANTPCY